MSKKERSEGKRAQRSSPEEGRRSRSASPSAAAEPFVRGVSDYDNFKQNVPLLYDMFIHSNLEWPSYACAWGPVLPERDAASSAGGAAAAAAGAATPGGTTSLQPPSAPPTPTTPGAAAAAAVPQLTGAALTPRLYSTSYVTQHVYLSRSTDSRLEREKWVGSPNMLLRAEIYYPNQYRTQEIGKMQNFDEDQRNPCLLVRKKIVHPGEINRIKVVPQYPDLIATHTDSPLVYVWNTHTQPTRRSQLNTDPSVPDLTLQGHVERSDCNTLYYALDCSQHNPFIISGGSDQKICLWSIEDYCSTLLTTAHVEARAAAAASSAGLHAGGVASSHIGSPHRAAMTPSKKHVERLLSPRITFSGHSAQVEEVCFHPRHQELLCSVGDDKLLMLWDMRLGGARSALRIHTSHADDVNAVHWNAVNDNLLVTGSSDHSVKLIDLRRIASSDSFTRRYTADAAGVRAAHSAAGDSGSRAIVHTFRGHKGNVTNVQWHSNGEYFASGSDDGDLCVWSIRGVEELQHSFPGSDGDGSPTHAGGGSGGSQLPARALLDGSLDGQPEHLLFRHTGHRTAVVNFAWNNFVKDGWTLASLSDDSADETLVGGGRLHVWRITDMLTKDFAQTSNDFAAQAARAAAASAAAAAQGASGANKSASSPAAGGLSSSPTPSSPSNQHGQAAGATGMSDDAADNSRSASATRDIDAASSDEPPMDLPPPDEDDDEDEQEQEPDRHAGASASAEADDDAEGGAAPMVMDD